MSLIGLAFLLLGFVHVVAVIRSGPITPSRSPIRSSASGYMVRFQDGQTFTQSQIGQITLDGEFQVFLSEVLFVFREQGSGGIVVTRT